MGVDADTWPEQEHLLKARLLDELGAAVVASDADCRIQYWSEGAERLYGWSQSEVLGRTTFEVLTPWDAAPRRWSADGQHTQGQQQHAVELELAHKDGRRLVVLAITVPLFEGETLSGALGVSMDIGYQKVVQKELREARGFLAAITNNMAEGMVATDLGGMVTFMNAAAERLLGWSAADLLGKRIHEICHYERPDGSPYPIEDCPLTRVRTTGAAARVDRDAFIRQDGSHVYVAYSASPWSAGETGGAVVVFEDISESIDEELRHQRERDKLAWIGRIEDALAAGRLVLHAQPVVSLLDGSVTRHELLVRMKDADGAVILPGSFLPTAEEYGLIQRIDEWVAMRAIELARSGHAVSFNVSAKSMTNALVNTLRRGLADNGVPAKRLICEITETALIRDIEVGEAFVTALQELGCSVALDDFGAGYAGFSHLKRLPVSFLKIDVQFVRDLVTVPASRHVVTAIVNLARDFGVETIAEGAEDRATLELLADLGVDYAQGIGVAPPAPLEQALASQARMNGAERERRSTIGL